MIFLAVIATVIFYKNNQDNIAKLGQYQQFGITQNQNKISGGKYNYKELDPLTLSYIKKFRNGQLLNNVDSSKKLFLYYDFKTVNCPYRRYFQGLMSQYKKDENWAKKYDIKGLEYPTESISLNVMVGSLEEKEFNAYIRDCGESFCIVDITHNRIFIPEKGSIYTSQKNSYNYVYGVLRNFYNK